MKHTLLTICLILFALPSWGNNVVCNLTGFNCPEIDDFDKLFEVDGILYKKFSDTPFTGNVTDGEQQGFVKEGKKDGSWVEYFNDGTLMEKRNYKDGEKDGLVEFYYKNGQLRDKGNYKEGRLDGLWEYYYENGKLREKIKYNDGKEDGLAEKYYENGQLQIKENWEDGKLDGLWERYYKSGQLWMKENYKDGKKDGLWEWYYENGQLTAKGNWKDGKEDGLREVYHENGQLKLKENYKDGKISDGLHKVYDKEGYLEKLEFYINHQSLSYYESHNLTVVETGKNFNSADFFDDDGNFKIVTVIDSKTQIPFSGEYIYINNVDEKKDFYGSMIYNFKNGKLDGKGSEFDENNKRYYRGDMKNGMEHGFYEYKGYNDKGIIDFLETGYFNLNKRYGTWVIIENGEKTKTFWKNGIQQN